MTADDPDRLRAQLLDMRLGLIERLTERVTGGDLALLGSVGAALAAVDDMVAEGQGE
jgi:hypothetical protein